MFRSAAMFAATLALSPLAAAPVLAQTPAAAAPTTAQAEATLKKTVTDMQAGTPDYANMDPKLAEAIKAQPAMLEQIKALGEPKTFTRVGDGENPWQYDVAFTVGITLTWTISLAADGKIAGLFVKPKG